MSKIEVCQEYIANFGILYESEVCKKGIKGQKKYQTFQSSFLDHNASIHEYFMISHDSQTNSYALLCKSMIFHNFALRFTWEFFLKGF